MVVARQNVVEYNYGILFVYLSIMVYDSLIKFYYMTLLTPLHLTEKELQLQVQKRDCLPGEFRLDDCLAGVSTF